MNKKMLGGASVAWSRAAGSSTAAGLAVRFACESAAKLNASAGWGEKQQCQSGENHPKLDASSNRNQD